LGFYCSSIKQQRAMHLLQLPAVFRVVNLTLINHIALKKSLLVLEIKPVV
jgi:hypothetical protein